MQKWLSKNELIEETINKGLGKLSKDGALIVETGEFTGRAAHLRYVVNRPEVEKTIDWGNINKPIAADSADDLFSRLERKLQDANTTYCSSGHVGPFKIKIQSMSPWHVIFFNNMFRSKPLTTILDADKCEREIQVLHDPYGKVSDLGITTDNDAIVVLDPVEWKILVIGTAYAGEIKKSAFSLCNYVMPEYGVFPMHASANSLEDGSNSCVLFGLSGTGKTTLSASHDRSLIGDDEIIWSKNGLSNLEGGCYAKLIDLTEDKEPEIFRAANRFGSILENVAFDEKTREVDFFDCSKTENTRGSYGISALNTLDQYMVAKQPNTIVFLTADAFGAMPAVAKLDSNQAQYHFISGYTAKVAGTEIGVTEPKAAFSACFGAPFMPRHPSVYGEMLAKLATEHNASIWLLNTGWTDGGYGKGDRFPLKVSRQILKAIQSGELDKAPRVKHPIFGFEVPTSCPEVDTKFLQIPAGDQVLELAAKFVKNMEKMASATNPEVIQNGGPVMRKAAAPYTAAQASL